MPKTLACSPLKPKPVVSQRFTRSLLLSYSDSPAQRSYVLPEAEATSDADEEDDEEDDEIDFRADVGTMREGVSNGDAPGFAGDATEDGGSLSNLGDKSADKSSTNGSKANGKLSAATRTLQSARQVLVSATRRSLELGERSVSATFQTLRSRSTSSMSNSELDTVPDEAINRDHISNDDDDSFDNPPSSSTSTASTSNQDRQHDAPEPESNQHEPPGAKPDREQFAEPEPRQKPELKQQDSKPPKKRAPRMRTASYQSALTKYLPAIFTRGSSSKAAGDATETRGSDSDGGVRDTISSAGSSGESNQDSYPHSAQSSSLSGGRMKCFPRWQALRHRHSEGDNQSEHEEHPSADDRGDEE